MKNAYFLFVFVLIACASAKNTDRTAATTIEYKVSLHRAFADSVWSKVKKLPPGITLDSQIQNLKSTENPNPAYYVLTVTDSLSKLSYLEPIEVDRNARLIRHVAPFTEGDSYKFVDSSAVYVDMSEQFPNICMKKENLKFAWTNGKKDSLIAGTKVHLMIGNNENSKIKAWINPKFPASLSSYDIYCEEGFVLAYELSTYNQAPFKSITRKVYPTKIKKSSQGKLAVPDFESKKMMTKQEILHYFRKMKSKGK